jgi:hypothetical protein
VIRIKNSYSRFLLKLSLAGVLLKEPPLSGGAIQFPGGSCTRSPAPFRGTVSSVIAGNYNSAVVIRAKAEPLLRPFKGRDASVSAAPMLGFRLNF